MDWKAILRTLEFTKQWDEAIEFMQEVIAKNQSDMDAYIAMNYLLMNLLVEEDHDESKHDYYEMLTKKYFDESYERFSHNPEFLYYTGRTAVMSEWYFGIKQDDCDAMIDKAFALDPHNPIYQWNYYDSLATKNVEDEAVVSYAKKVLDKDSLVKKILASKGAVGAYLLDMMINWAEKVIAKCPYRYGHNKSQ